MRSGTAVPDYRCWFDNKFLADKRVTRLLTAVAALSTKRHGDQQPSLHSLHALLMINFLGKFSFPFGFSISLPRFTLFPPRCDLIIEGISLTQKYFSSF